MRLGQTKMEEVSWETSSTKVSIQDPHAGLCPVHFPCPGPAVGWVEGAPKALATQVQFAVPTKPFGLH